MRRKSSKINSKQSRFIEQVMVIGEGEKMPCAIIQPNFQVLKDYLKIKGITEPASNADLIKEPAILDIIGREIEKNESRFGTLGTNQEI